ncbi:MAG: alpha/beta hydrolase [Gemmataceae bacterium]
MEIRCVGPGDKETSNSPAQTIRMYRLRTGTVLNEELFVVGWFWAGLLLMVSVPVAVLTALVLLHYYLRWKYVDLIARIFQERPLFIIPRGNPLPDAEDVTITTSDGLKLRGCYVSTPHSRRGVVLFGLEFGSNRWSCLPYCEHLIENGFDVFSLESRGQGESEKEPGYDPLQWVTDREVKDAQAALDYLKQRPDSDSHGIGFFGISRGAGAGLIAGAHDAYVRCFATDGLFASYTTLVPYMRQWFRIYDARYLLQGLIPSWYYGLIGLAGLRTIEKESGCRFMHLEKSMAKLASRPLLMIHGGADTYIKPEMARSLFAKAREPKELWIVDGAKHNQSLQVAGEGYKRRVLDFFLNHLHEPMAKVGRDQTGNEVVVGS